MSPEPDVPVPFPTYYGSPGCPACGYSCGCCCHCSCQTMCLTPYTGEFRPGYEPTLGDYCECDENCHGGHEPWDCHNWATRYDWAKAKSKRLETS